MKQRIATALSIVITICLISAAIVMSKGSSAEDGQSGADRQFTVKQLAAYNGQNGNKCFVAVAGKVYGIEQGLLWQNGSHVTSGGAAHCGKDLTEAIKKSPHGTGKLSGLTVEGTLSSDK